MKWSTAVHERYRAVTTQLQSGFVCPGNSILINGHWELDGRLQLQEGMARHSCQYHIGHTNYCGFIVHLCNNQSPSGNGIFNNDMQLCN